MKRIIKEDLWFFISIIIIVILFNIKLPYYIGLIIVFLGVTFYFSEHRSFTHSIFGVLTLTAAVSLILIWSFQLIVAVSDINDYYLVMAILTVLVSFLFLNKKVLMLFLPVFFISLFVFPTGNVNYIEIVLSLFLGVFSHIVLDSFTPSGIKIFAPLSSRKVYRNFGIMSTFVLIVLAMIFHAPVLFNLYEQYVSYSISIIGI